MPVPVILPRAEHKISRRDIDPEALKVLYRLHENHHVAYLVGGSVRDLLLGRRPKDFDIGTSAHPYQIKKLFRNCWIIGRRFRLAHIKFGPKTIEVATFRRVVPDLPPEELAGELGPGNAVVVASSPEPIPGPDAGMIHRDNTFGTPEEDAFRRDFTINGLFYDIGTFSVIDYVGGLEDLQKRVVRSIGDPRVRFVEDPVRMLRAVVMASRLDFELDPLVAEAIAEYRGLIAEASPARLLEEYYKILRSGYAEATFRGLAETRLLELITPELKNPSEALWDALDRLDTYRRRFPSAPPELTNTILIGSLLVPTGALDRRSPPSVRDPHGDRLNFGILQIARRDMERLRHIRQLTPRMADPELPPRVARGIVGRPAFPDALVWLELFRDEPERVEFWKQLRTTQAPATGEPGEPASPSETLAAGKPRRRRRRRRRGGNRQPEGA